MKKLAIIIVMGLFSTAVMADVAGRTFEANVISSFGTQFSDCFRFDDAGNVFVDGLGQTQTFSQDFLGNSPAAWQSSSRTGDALAIAFHGRERDAMSWIGNGINETGDTFIVIAFENPGCVVAPATYGSYMR